MRVSTAQSAAAAEQGYAESEQKQFGSTEQRHVHLLVAHALPWPRGRGEAYWSATGLNQILRFLMKLGSAPRSIENCAKRGKSIRCAKNPSRAGMEKRLPDPPPLSGLLWLILLWLVVPMASAEDSRRTADRHERSPRLRFDEKFTTRSGFTKQNPAVLRRSVTALESSLAPRSNIRFPALPRSLL